MAHQAQPPQIIHIQPMAPAKPVWGAPCNGCGVCCLVDPCPLGVVLSGRRRGACAAVQWSDTAGLYRCGAVVEPRRVWEARLWRPLRWLATPMGWMLGRLARRWISAGSGCDSSLEVSAPAASTTIPPHYD